jgi:hypothetical protein
MKENIADVSKFYSLQREHAKRQLKWKESCNKGNEEDAPREYRVKLEGYHRGQGFVHMTAIQGDEKYSLWLFPQSLPNYLHYVDILGYLDRGSICSLSCRQSSTNASDLFLIAINKPI